jgi:hypothetical protein
MNLNAELLRPRPHQTRVLLERAPHNLVMLLCTVK